MHRGEGDDLLTFVKKKSENKNKYKTQLPKEGNMKFHKIKKRKKKEDEARGTNYKSII